MDIISSRIPCNPTHPENQEEIKIEQILIDESYSQDVPEELRMIHIFLRESNQLNYKFTPNYARFKWMARNIFHYVGDERARIKMKRQIINEYIKELSEKKKIQYIENVCNARYKSIIAHGKANLIIETIRL
jgi:hypothetical protein